MSAANISIYPKQILSVLRRRAAKKDSVTITIPLLCKLTGFSRNCVKRALGKLQSLGIITISVWFANTGNTYTLSAQKARRGARSLRRSGNRTAMQGKVYLGPLRPEIRKQGFQK